MTKLLLALLAVALLASASRAEDAPAERSGTVMGAVIRETVEIAARLRGRALGSRVYYGMTSRQVTALLGEPDGRLGEMCLVYHGLRMTVCLSCEFNAVADRVIFVTSVHFQPILPELRRRVVVPPPPLPLIPSVRRQTRVGCWFRVKTRTDSSDRPSGIDPLVSDRPHSCQSVQS